MKKFTWWSPGGATAKLTEKEKIWLKEHPDWEIKWTALNFWFKSRQRSK